ncbi:MAG: hypothetical protein AAGM67_10725, partial [Bacteroidota bacterium]
TQLHALLIRHGSVSVPGIGTFIKSRQSALVQHENRLISPPREVVKWRKEVDSRYLFGKLLTEAQFLHPEISEQQETELSLALQSRLRVDGKAVLPELGTLIVRDGKLRFTSTMKDTDRSDDQHYGLQPVKLPNKPQSSGIPEITTTPMNNGNQTYETTRKASPIKWQPYLLVGILVLAGVLVIYNGPFLRSQANTKSVVISEENTTPFQEVYPSTSEESPEAEIASAQKVSNTTAQQKPAAVQPTPAEESTETTIEPKPAETQRVRGLEDKSTEVVIEDLATDGKLSDLANESTIPQTVLDPTATVYHLISASFTQLSKAEGFADEMKAEGFRPEVILPGDGPSQIHRVSIFQSNDLSQVKDIQSQLEKAGKKLLWIYHSQPIP